MGAKWDYQRAIRLDPELEAARTGLVRLEEQEARESAVAQPPAALPVPTQATATAPPQALIAPAPPPVTPGPPIQPAAATPAPQAAVESATADPTALIRQL